ncbi:NAD(P)/FAD-dependent oxidoreductase [Paeniglutamicibacter sp. ZC-3]|uniref:flavin-containing monooxygenase n=1 Tax=Paeniglutamicibacter sp. ZC-3 TaxID=2986919 RepID=UPI0021F78498|nr:NAD(P)/FAD-dependent oxidoreductase [Paeniglutamicibacter sp. ZC-3]MCV9993731.1 NAD(P)/FAD-dependent oxidoreductase [Paeniglutamicibacter sp. ZC-3]
MKSQRQNHFTIIIGAGHCGLAMAHELAVKGEEFVVLEAGQTPGNSWSSRWESLELFTPAEHDGLPGKRFPAAHGTFPTARAVSEYLRTYAASFQLPIQTSTTARRLEVGLGGVFRVRTDRGLFEAGRVVVATGVHQVPRIPPLSTQISADAMQLHSSEYRNPAQIPDGPVAVVGFGTSGAQIACELAPSHRVTIFGRPTSHVPEAFIRYAPALYWLLVHRLLTRSTPAGRKVAQRIHHRGAPLIRVSTQDVAAAGVAAVGRIEAVRDGVMLTQDGIPVEASTIIWATGYHPDYSWIDGLGTDENGYPFHRRGVSTEFAGLGFLGIPFQYGLTSGIIGGAGRDARHLARRLDPDPAVANKMGFVPDAEGTANG